MERLQKVMAHAGVASRRKSEEIIAAGRVKVNGRKIRSMGVKVSEDDLIEVDGQVITGNEKKVYYLLNKPINYITSTHDQFGRKTVLDLIETKQRIYPVGRLDFDSSGLLLLTNDGELTQILTHPSFEIWKSYIVEIDSFIKDEILTAFNYGIRLKDGLTSPAESKIIKRNKDYTKLEIRIYEGKNRQIRRMFSYFDIEVKSLHRIRQGPLEIGKLEPGQYRELNQCELESLKKIKDELN